jgi:hypothetical protein
VRALLGVGLLLAFAGSAAAAESLSSGAPTAAASSSRAPCARGARIQLSGTLASELSDGTPVRMSGSYRGRIGSQPG